MRVADLMTREVVRVTPQTPVKELLHLFEEHGVSGFPVVDAEGQVVGVVSEEDLMVRESGFRLPRYVTFLDAIIPLGDLGELREEFKKAVGATVRQVMSAPAVTIAPEADVRDAARVMALKDVNRLPVVDAEGRLVGIVARHDLVHHLASEG